MRVGSSCLVLGWFRAGGALIKERVESEVTELVGLYVKVRLQRSRSPSLGACLPWARSLSRIKAPNARASRKQNIGKCSQCNLPSSPRVPFSPDL